MEFRKLIEYAMNGLLLVGFLALSIGIVTWILSLLERYSFSWYIQLALIGFILMLLAVLGAKLCSLHER